MALFPITAGLVNLATGAPVATDNYVGAILINATNFSVRAALAGGTEYANGLLFTDIGQLLFNDATAGLPANTQYINGIPLAPDGSMCIAQAAAVTWANGLPYAANGAISASVAP